MFHLLIIHTECDDWIKVSAHKPTKDHCLKSDRQSRVGDQCMKRVTDEADGVKRKGENPKRERVDRWNKAIREAPCESMQPLFSPLWLCISQMMMTPFVGRHWLPRLHAFGMKWNTWCGYMKGGLPECGPALPILMLISSDSVGSNDGSSAFSLSSLESRGRARAVWGSAPTPCG